MSVMNILLAAGSTSMRGHRRWRLNLQQAEASTLYPPTPGVSLAEVQFHDRPGGAQLCVGGVANASSIYTGYTAGGSGPPAAAVDGSDVSMWTSQSAPPQWWSYDFGYGNAFQVAEVTLQGTPGFAGNPTAFALEWSDDNSVWTVEKSWFSPAPWGSQELRVFS